MEAIKEPVVRIRRKRTPVEPVGVEYLFKVYVDQNGNVRIRDKKDNPFREIAHPIDVATLRMVTIVLGIPQRTDDGYVVSTAIVDVDGEDDEEAGGCTYPCQPGYVMGRPACICP